MKQGTGKRRVAVTGMGVVSCLGNDVDTLWRHIKGGISGITALDRKEFKDIDSRVAGVVRDLNIESYLDRKESSRYDPFIQFGYAAARQALDQAAITDDAVDKARVGVCIGTGGGGVQTLLNSYRILFEKGPKWISPFMVPVSIHNMLSGLVGIKTGFTGPNFSMVSACATGNHAIGEAYLKIAHGYADAMLAGGSDATITPLYFAGFSKMHAMSRRNDAPQQASRPFDRDRDGFVMAEGAGVLFLEAYEHAQARHVRILGEIAGYAATADAYHMTASDYHGAAAAMQLAIERAGIERRDIAYVNAHGTSTPMGDIAETRAIKSVFGDEPAGLKVSSTKSMTGHMFGATGGVEAVITLQSIREGIYPPTINLEHPDPECSLDYVPNHAQTGTIGYALSNGFAFGGHNAVLVFRKV